MNRMPRVALVLVLLLCPARAWGHIHLKRSEPAAGSRITSAPQIIRLWLSERPELSMTFISIKDANGNEFALTPPENHRGDPLTVSVRMSQPLPAGRYTVSWRTVASDGHPARGAFSFVVAMPPPVPTGVSGDQVDAVTDTAGAGDTTVASPTESENDQAPDAASSLTHSLSRALSFVGILVLVGVTTFRNLVLPRARAIDVEMKARMEQRAAVMGLAASVLVIIAALARLYLESRMMMNAMPEMHMSMTRMAMHTQWGRALRLEIGATLVALLAFALAARRSRGAWVVATISAVVIAVTPALSGHAAASPRFTSLMIGTDFLHVLSGSAWLGSLLAVMVVGVPLSLTLEGAERWRAVASLVNSFSPVALAAAALVVFSGVIASWVHLEHLTALWQTAYGQVLLVKLFLVAIALSIGAYNSRQVQPRLATEAGTGHLRRSALVELSVGFLILLVTGFLTGISA